MNTLLKLKKVNLKYQTDKNTIKVLNNIDLIKSLLLHLENLLSKTEYLPLIKDNKYNNLIEHIGQAYFKLGHYEKSKKLLKRISQLKPSIVKDNSLI